jgi:hypothetical protein
VGAYWDLVTVLLWIKHRDEQAVRDQLRQWRLEDLLDFLHREGPALFAVLEPHLESESGESGGIYADAQRERYGERLPIPPTAWRDVGPAFLFDMTPVSMAYVAPDTLVGEGPSWVKPRYRAADVKRVFPARSVRGEGAAAPSAPAVDVVPTVDVVEIPDTLAGRIAAAMRELHPEGRWAGVGKMWGDLLDRPEFKGASKRSVEEALKLLSDLDPAKWRGAYIRKTPQS